ncbi:MAG TPA: SMI1/KNR4 family protein [Candidatus Methylomirabilis sp.]|nr:SMI1/KNR4 family protein [Candidatus Methylomirabilis sp.]
MSDAPSQTLLIEVFGPLVAAFLLLMAAFGIRRLLHQFRHRMTPEQRQAARDSFRNRLVHPNASEVEQGMGALLPQRLLTLYDDHRTILTEELEIRRPNADGKHAAEWIEAFLPLDLESQKYTVDLAEHGWGRGFCFATDGAGNFYWVPVSETRQLDAPVFFACHDPFRNEQVAPSLADFLSWPRTLHSEVVDDHAPGA